jgi:hypothetical protein
MNRSVAQAVECLLCKHKPLVPQIHESPSILNPILSLKPDQSQSQREKDDIYLCGITMLQNCPIALFTFPKIITFPQSTIHIEIYHCVQFL